MIVAKLYLYVKGAMKIITFAEIVCGKITTTRLVIVLHIVELVGIAMSLAKFRLTGRRLWPWLCMAHNLLLWAGLPPCTTQ